MFQTKDDSTHVVLVEENNNGEINLSFKVEREDSGQLSSERIYPVNRDAAKRKYENGLKLSHLRPDSLDK